MRKGIQPKPTGSKVDIKPSDEASTELSSSEREASEEPPMPPISLRDQSLMPSLLDALRPQIRKIPRVPKETATRVLNRKRIIWWQDRDQRPRQPLYSNFDNNLSFFRIFNRYIGSFINNLESMIAKSWSATSKIPIYQFWTQFNLFSYFTLPYCIRHFEFR